MDKLMSMAEAAKMEKKMSRPSQDVDDRGRPILDSLVLWHHTVVVGEEEEHVDKSAQSNGGGRC